MYTSIWPCAIYWVPRGNTTLRGYSIQWRHTCLDGPPCALVGWALVGPLGPHGPGPCWPPQAFVQLSIVQ